jgi:hypothetical protein
MIVDYYSRFPVIRLLSDMTATQPETRKLQQVCCDATCDHQADIRMRLHRLLRLDNIKSVASCQQTRCKLWTADLMQVVNCRLAASCELQAWCKLWTADLMQVVNCGLDAICELQTWCKLWTADLMQVVNCRLDASCELQTWCKLWTADLMQVVIHRLDASCQKAEWGKRLMKLRVSTILNKKRPNRLPYFGCSVS